MPPANDDWAAAQSLGSGSSGHTNGTNVSATAEGSEPSNSGKTVWYAWTPSADQAVYFSTLYNVSEGELALPHLKTILQIFTGAAVGTLTEVTYLPGTWNKRFSNWEFGSVAAFKATNGTTYYIRVDGVAGDEGLFPLSWGDYHPTNFGPCDGCAPQSDPLLECIATAQLPDATVDYSSTSFGTFALGKYRVVYCGGSFNYKNTFLSTAGTSGQTPSAYWGSPEAPVNTFFESSLAADVTVSLSICGLSINNNMTTGQYPFPLAGSPSFDVYFTGCPTPPAYSSQAGAEAAFRCFSADFEHTGGDISLLFNSGYRFYNPDTFGNTRPAGINQADNGTVNPSFTLYHHIPSMTFVTAGAFWTTPGSAAKCGIQVKNNNSVDWNGVTATLDASGGVSSPSTVTGLNFPAGSTGACLITFNASSVNITATLRLSCADWASDIVIPVNLAPIVSLVSVGAAVDAGFSCSGFHVYHWDVTLKNTGYWSLSTPITVSDTNGQPIVNGSCTPTTLPATITPYASDWLGIDTSPAPYLSGTPGGTPQAFTLQLKSNGTTSPFRVDFTVKDGGGTTIATFSAFIAFPA